MVLSTREYASHLLPCLEEPHAEKVKVKIVAKTKREIIFFIKEYKNIYNTKIGYLSEIPSINKKNIQINKNAALFIPFTAH